MVKGNLNISHLDNWYLGLEYIPHPNPTSGFSFVDNSDVNRYKLITSHIHRLETHQQFFKNNFMGMTNHLFAVSKMLPGMILPYHIDKYDYIKKTFNVSHEQIKRIIVFLEDWKPGHISEINSISITNWKKGDWVEWQGETPHMAANLGHHDRYILQITGTVL